MHSTLLESSVQTQGHVVVFAQNCRWLEATKRNLEAAGHTCQQASAPADLRELLLRQRFDLLVLKVRSEAVANELAEALEGVRPAHHTIALGSASALSLRPSTLRSGTFRYVPGTLSAQELTSLAETSIGAEGASDEEGEGNGECTDSEVDLQEVIDRAAAAVSSQANHKRQRFNTAVSGPALHVVGNRLKLRRTLTSLFRLIVMLAPPGATVSVEAHTAAEGLTARVRVSNGAKARGSAAQLTEELRDEADALSKVSEVVRDQGGMLWVELAGPAAFGICLTLPLPHAVAAPASA